MRLAVPKRLVWALVAAATVLALFSVAGLMRWHSMVQKERYDALWAVGWAALDYLRETGDSPKDADTLIRYGMFHEDPASGLLVPAESRQYKSVLAKYARQVRLRIPASIEDYTLMDGNVVRSESGEPMKMISCSSLDSVSLEFTNKRFAREWFAIMSSRREAAPISSKP